MLTRSEVLEAAGVSDDELNELESRRLIVPIRSWRTLWMTEGYHPDQVHAIRWLVESRRVERDVRERESELIGDVLIDDEELSERS
jgi:hypothetical protein